MPAEKVLFVCIGNAGRSQMAQAFAERAGFEVRSAGSRAESELHPEMITAMSEIGFDLTGRFLLRNVLEPRGQGHSDAREGFINAVTRHLARISSS